jgi:hypothetical protein
MATHDMASLLDYGLITWPSGESHIAHLGGANSENRHSGDEVALSDGERTSEKAAGESL